MSPFPIFPVRQTKDRFPDDGEPRFEKKKKPSSITKVKGLVLERMSRPASRGALFPSATAPRVLIDLLAPFLTPELEDLGETRDPRDKGRVQKELKDSPESTSKTKKNHGGKGAPIGLKRKRNFPLLPEGLWVNPFNALMQFLLFLPGFADLFFFAPKSFQPFQDFIDQYKRDQQENRSVSSANTHSLIRCAMKKLPPPLFKGGVDLYQIFQCLVKALFPSLPILSASPVKSYFSDSIAFHPEWHIIWDVKQKKTLEELVQEKFSERPPELLISIQGLEGTSCNLIQKQFFAPSEWFCYDLDAFIEMRPDSPFICSIAYLKANGSWYQCDDDRISLLRSNCLNVPLCRSVLLHYKRIEFGRPGWG